MCCQYDDDDDGDDDDERVVCVSLAKVCVFGEERHDGEREAGETESVSE